jgi:hypothetical protein
MHGRFPTMNKFWLATELFPLLSKEEKRLVYFPTKEERKGGKFTKADLRLSKEDQDVLDKHRAK